MHEVESFNEHRRASKPSHSPWMTDDQIDAWIGRCPTETERERLIEAIPNSSIPEAIATIFDSIREDRQLICDRCGSIGTAEDLVELNGPCGHDWCDGIMDLYQEDQ